ncbi:MAG: lytic murein transglycosylase, partial [Thermodesulfobacteriota bacterium]|nr:lytic murein transglycosylase [Thermodesulfobacteriota bacterium]
NWALDELYALIVLTQAIGRDPLNTPGSFAGALGPAQFIPTSFINYGIDGNNDNKKDPFDMQDAMASIANYLHCAGWTQDADITEKRKAVWAYNHSRVYVNTILMLCDRCTAP